MRTAALYSYGNCLKKALSIGGFIILNNYSVLGEGIALVHNEIAEAVKNYSVAV